MAEQVTRFPERDEPAMWAAKDEQVEQKLCEELAALAAGFDVANDPSAKGLPSGRCSVRLRETAMYVAAASGQETTMDYDTLLVELSLIHISEPTRPY